MSAAIRQGGVCDGVGAPLARQLCRCLMQASLVPVWK